ncbi:hypothetical protein WR25_06177 [Diploscapter pachys]|uniref:DNA helicase n=1 Tax=Diploscapter pachys TaxID=2018661 RepID=A0A2A2LSE7_9BILA|nr:hypothetical protein WR25_06177 [Diploscapter pachys]
MSENDGGETETSLNRKRKALEPLENSLDDSFEQEVTIISRNSIGGEAEETGNGIFGKRSNKIFVTDNDYSDWENDEPQKSPTTQNKSLSSTSTPKKRAKKIQVEPVASTESHLHQPAVPQLLDTISLATVTLRVKQNNIQNGNHLVCEDANGQERLVYLDSSWSCTMVRESSIIRLVNVPTWQEHDFFVSNDCGGLLVVNPDTLMSSSNVSNSYFCARKTILRDRFHGMCDASKPLLIGIVVHELVQWAVLHAKELRVTKEILLEYWRGTICPTVVYSMTQLMITPSDFETELMPYVENITGWFMKCIPSCDDPENLVPLPTASKCIGIHDIEENFWEPKYGLKGKIDITMKVESPEGEIFFEGMELKTGKVATSIEHNAQVMLYSLMLESRYSGPPRGGSLVYLKEQKGVPVEMQPTNMKYVIQRRNELAHYASDIGGQDLPPPRDDPHFCPRCECAMPCMLYQQVVEKGRQSNKDMFALAQQMTDHLKPVHFEYFKRWTTWLFEEWKTEAMDARPQSSLWNTTKEERESQHCCVHSLRIEKQVPLGDGNLAVTFMRDTPFPHRVFDVGDYCVVSHSTSYAVRTGTILEINKNSLTLKFGTKLDDSIEYFVDKYCSSSLQASSLGGVVMIMQNDERATKLRHLIVDLQPPQKIYFVKQFPTLVHEIMQQTELNAHQKRAILACIYTMDYAIIEGLPGAGKTTVIAVLLACLIALGRTALLVSYTHSAVDNVLLKAKKLTNPRNILRLTRGSLKDEQLKELTLAGQMERREDPMGHEFMTKADQDYVKMNEILTTTPIIACTCHHISRDSLFAIRNTFDLTIVDEASMIVEPLLIPALCLSNRFVLVGDTKQLCPLVQSENAKEGMSISLMEKLSLAHPDAVYSLVMQYRMNRQLAVLPSKMFYSNRLVCANSTVSAQSLNTYFTQEAELSEKLSSIISGSLEDSRVFVSVEKNELKDKCHMLNSAEAHCIANICDALIKRGLPPDAIGVMCTYRRQIEVVSQNVNNKAIEVSTVDTFQGRDKPVMILSLVWNSNCKKRCELLLEDRRVNVALTRAKTKLILVGSHSSMMHIGPMKATLTDCEEKWKVIEWSEEESHHAQNT